MSQRKSAPAFLLKPALVLIGVLALLKVSPSLVFGVLIGLALYALKGPRESLQALTIMFVVLNLNPGLFPFWGRGASLRWLVLFCAFGRVVWDGLLAYASWPLRILKPFCVYVLSLGVLAIAASRLPEVSIFKVVAFGIGVTTILTCYYRTRELGAYWYSWYFTIIVVIIGISIPFYFSSLGFLRNGRGFQGIMVHPQTFGPIAAPITAWLIACWFLKGQRTWLAQLGILFGLLAIITSQARTSMLMLVVGLATAFVLYWQRKSTLEISRIPRISLSFKVASVIGLLVVGVWQGGIIKEKLSSFVLKKVDEVESASFDIRADKIQKQIDNFIDMPLAGIGFGIPTNEDDWVGVSRGFLGLPTGFSVEKGFLPSAILEETGLIGSVLLMVFLIRLTRYVWQVGREPELALILAALVVNAGEAVFFSFGAMGLFFWLLIGCVLQNTEPSSVSRINSNKA